MQILKSGFLNTKIILAVIFALVLVLIVFFLLIFFKKIPQQSTQINQGKNSKIDINKLSQDRKIVSVIIFDNKIVPAQIHIDPGEAVSFANFTKQDLNVNITGSIYVGLPIKVNSVMYSPIFENGGIYKFSDTKNSSLSGQIIVSGPTPTPAMSLGSIRDVITPIVKVSNTAKVTIFDSGFKPTNINIKKGEIVQFSNQSKKKVEVQVESVPEGVIPAIEPGITLAAPPFSKPGRYSYQLKGELLMKGEIIVE